MNRILFKNRLEFREWLTDHAFSDEGIWLIFGKKGNPETLKASEALEEALCFGWIDGQIQSVDEDSYLKYFKQRSKTSNWSVKNRSLVEKLELQGLMTDLAGQRLKRQRKTGTGILQNLNRLPTSSCNNLRICLNPMKAPTRIL